MYYMKCWQLSVLVGKILTAINISLTEVSWVQKFPMINISIMIQQSASGTVVPGHSQRCPAQDSILYIFVNVFIDFNNIELLSKSHQKAIQSDTASHNKIVTMQKTSTDPLKVHSTPPEFCLIYLSLGLLLLVLVAAYRSKQGSYAKSSCCWHTSPLLHLGTWSK